MSVFFSVVLEDKPGALGHFARLLSESDVNIEAFVAEPSGVHILTDNADRTEELLKENGITFSSREVIEIELPNRPGELARLTTTLGDKGVNIAHTFGTATTSNNHGKIYIHVKDVDAAWEALEGYQ